jgi:peptidoglycan/xylan/chitin deacetylase (PgdA/CDA1 family)
MNTELARWIARGAVDTGLLAALEQFEALKRNELRILAYHRIGRLDQETGSLDPDLLSVTPDLFAGQMAFLRAKYHPVSVEEVLQALAGNQPLPPRSVLVTFDDGYCDFRDVAWPILQRFQIPAILFVPTDYLSGEGRMFWWDRLYQGFMQTQRKEIQLPSLGALPLLDSMQRREAFRAAKKLVMTWSNAAAMQLVEDLLEELAVTPALEKVILGWDDVRRLHKEGLYVGAHTCSHPILAQVTPDQARHEISKSQARLRQALGCTWPLFAYPSGHPADLDAMLASILSDEGFHFAVTMIEGHNRIGHTPPFYMRRVGMAPHLSLTEFRLALTGAYNIYGLLLRLRAGSLQRFSSGRKQQYKGGDPSAQSMQRTGSFTP